MRISMILFSLLILFSFVKPIDAAILRPTNNLGLVGYWSFNEGTSTTALDYSGNGNKGAVAFMDHPATSGSGWRANGKAGPALNFDGSNDNVVVEDSNSLDISTTFSISLWLKADNLSQTNKYLMGKINGGDNAYAMFWDYSNNAVEFYCGGSCAVGYPSANTRMTISDTNWHHVTYTYNGTTFRGYMDGVEAMTPVTVSLTLSTGSGQLFLGDFDGTAGANFEGSLDEIRIHSRALSATEVSGLYNLGIAKSKQLSNKDLVAYWSFNEGTSTSALDYSGNGHHGTFENGLEWATGKLGKAIYSDGSTNKYVNVPDRLDLDLSSGDFTISFWIKPAKGSNQIHYGGILDKMPGATGWCILWSGPNQITIWINGAYRAITTTSLVDNQWYHITFQKEGSVSRVYVNNVLENTGTAESPTDNSQELRIGYYSSSFYRTYGYIDEVRIHNRALSVVEISGLYNISAAEKKINSSQNTTGSSLDSGLVGLWSFNGADVNATTAFDRSGSGNHGTRTNGPAVAAGKVGQGMSFDGVDDYVSVTDSSQFDFGSGNFAISWWEYRGSNTNGTGSIFRNATGAYTPYVLGYSAGGSDLLIYMSSNNSSWDIANGQSLGAVSLNTWNHFTITRRGNDFYAYKNGVQTSTWNSSGSLAAGTGPLLLGGPYQSVYVFPGKLDEVRIYNRSLSGTEAQQLYVRGK